MNLVEKDRYQRQMTEYKNNKGDEAPADKIVGKKRPAASPKAQPKKVEAAKPAAKKAEPA